jgi:multimeric flavodoxin WrbA
MKIIAFNGSPRKGGNTETLLSAAIKGTGQEVTIYRLNTMDFSPCQNCGGCEETGECILEDEFTPVYEDIRTADRIILASPVFFMGLSAQTKAMVDRCQALWCEKFLLKREIPSGPHGRKGLILLVGGMEKEAGIDCAAKGATAFLRTVSIPENDTLKYMGVDAKGDILKHPTALKDAEEAGRKLAE